MVSAYARRESVCKGKISGIRPPGEVDTIPDTPSPRQDYTAPRPPCYNKLLPPHRPSRPNWHDSNSSRNRPRLHPKCPVGAAAGGREGRPAGEGQLLQGRPADLPTALPGLPPAGQATGRL